jgi:hypothetical protein
VVYVWFFFYPDTVIGCMILISSKAEHENSDRCSDFLESEKNSNEKIINANYYRTW